MERDTVGALAHHSEALIASAGADPLIGGIIRGESSREDYTRFLAGTYQYVRWSGPLLAETALGLRRTGRYPRLADAVALKTDEEAPHDRWVLDDLRACGVQVELVKAQEPAPAVQAYVQWSRALARAGSPAYLGAAYALEHLSMRCARAAADNLRARAEIPNIENAVSFLAGHGDADVHHVAVLDALVRTIDDAADQAELVASAAVLRTLYPRFFS